MQATIHFLRSACSQRSVTYARSEIATTSPEDAFCTCSALCTVSHALAPNGHRTPPPRPVDAPASADLGRRDLLLTLGAAGLLPLRALAASPEGTVVPQAELFETAAKVASKRIIVTGANSGVGLEEQKY